MMSHLSKFRNNLDSSLRFFSSSVTACQISGRNFFQVGDDVTTRTSKVSSVIITILTVHYFPLTYRTCICAYMFLCNVFGSLGKITYVSLLGHKIHAFV
ncbi:hypothetical protein Hanom_Chr00s183104g01832401 [Helianthus anomalus]